MQAVSDCGARAKFGRVRAAKLFPSHAACEIGIGRRFGDQTVRSLCSRNAGACGDRAPQRILDKQHSGFRVRQQRRCSAAESL